MEERPLIETNPYLRDADQYEDMLFVNVTTSAAVELGKIPASLAKKLKDKKQPLLINLDFDK